jgi:hypothetical protein
MSSISHGAFGTPILLPLAAYPTTVEATLTNVARGKVTLGGFSSSSCTLIAIMGSKLDDDK